MADAPLSYPKYEPWDTRFGTRAIHVGQAPDPATAATIVPVYQTETFTQDAVGEHRGFEYSHNGNPTRNALEAALAALEGSCSAFGSGMAAIHGAIQLLSAGDQVVVCDDMYGGSFRLFPHVMPRFGGESLIGYPWTMSHGAFPPEEKRRKCITQGTVKLSVGIEHVDDLCADLDQALGKAARAG